MLGVTIVRPGLEVLLDEPGDGAAVERKHWYDIAVRMWLRRGDPVRWDRPWGSVPWRLSPDHTELTTRVRMDREYLINGLFYGCLGMRVGGKRLLKIAPHLAFRSNGVPGVVPPNALLTAEVRVLSEVASDA